MIVDHIGYAVKDITKARLEFEKLGYQFEELIGDTDRNLYIQFGRNGDTRLELLQTLDLEKDSPITGIIKKNGPTPYHICYKTECIELEIDNLKKNKWMVVHPPEKAIAFNKDGMVRVAFLLHRHIGMIELVEINDWC
jgi:methylmalonyl-CoA/ethylmalonyl-CoA epimerase